MTALPSLTSRQGLVALTALAGSLVAAAGVLMPNGLDVAAALRRARPPVVPAAAAPAVAPAPTMERLSAMFAQGQQLQPVQLQQLLAWSARTASAATLTAIADRLSGFAPVPTAQVTYDIVASGRPDVARAFLESRPERAEPANWRLRLELHRTTGDLAFAQSMVRSAATRPGTASAEDFVSAAYAVQLPEAILTAAEHRAIPALDQTKSLDLVRHAVNSGQLSLVPRIDRAGTPAWRSADPWLAMNLAQRAGDFSTALRYAALLPKGAADARRALIIASGDKAAIRTMLLAEGRSNAKLLPSAAQQLLDTGFRADAVALLREGCAACSPDDDAARRLLFLMGPRPDADSLAWLRAKAQGSEGWAEAYAQRERPAQALAFMEGRHDADTTPVLLERMRLAGAARDRQAGLKALARLLDGRALTAGQARAMTAASPAGLDKATTRALVEARVRAGAALPKDQLDLAWDGWNRSDVPGARDHLARYLATQPGDAAALRLMAGIERKGGGDRAARPWLEKALAATPAPSFDRAEILEQLGRTDEALALVQTLRRAAPADARLKAAAGRLLVAAGDPGKARKVMQP